MTRTPPNGRAKTARTSRLEPSSPESASGNANSRSRYTVIQVADASATPIPAACWSAASQQFAQRRASRIVPVRGTAGTAGAASQRTSASAMNALETANAARQPYAEASAGSARSAAALPSGYPAPKRPRPTWDRASP